MENDKWKMFLVLVFFLLSVTFTCHAQEEDEKQASLADILTDECGTAPDSADDYLMPSAFANVLVAEVTNGNTIIVELTNKTRKSVRLTGLNVPDIKTNEGKQARQILLTLLSNKRIFLLQYEETSTDKAEGIIALAKTYADINLAMLKSGMALYEQSKFLSDYDNCAYKQTFLKAKKK